MAAVDVVARSNSDAGTDRQQSRRRPFTSWVKKLAHFKQQNDLSYPSHKKTGIHHHFIPKKPSNAKTSARADNLQPNNPYPESGRLRTPRATSDTDTDPEAETGVHSAPNGAASSLTSLPLDGHVQTRLAQSNKSTAPTIATKAETVHSDAGLSKAMTTKTGGALSSIDDAGVNSTFSSPSPSQKSLATTLTTIQSTSPHATAAGALTPTNTSSDMQNAGSATFSNQYPNPLTAVPQHLIPSGPSTYNGATANNLLTDDASILTLASSSRKNRRRSMDTDASVRALAPSSVWDGGSRESLPLSVLSGNLDNGGSTSGGQHGGQGRPSASGLASAERASVYSSQSIGAPVLASERNSYYATSLVNKSASNKDRDNRSIDGRSLYNKDVDDGKSLSGGRSLHGSESLRNYEGSMRSGGLDHGRSDSVPSGNVTPYAAGPTLARAFGPSRTNSNNGREEDDMEEHPTLE